jgi:5-methylthioadenosine/S-adenosylhomocysteine deaminase
VILSADWVLPVSGPPIADGAVAFEDGRIVAVGPAAELGEGERHRESVILPGFVNAHTHLEYAVYAGFGDGLPFEDWLRLHIERKARIDRADAVAIARLGAAQNLASGVTTLADCSFSGAAADACAELGLHALVYLEVFGADPESAIARFEQLRETAEHALSSRVRLGISPHAPYTVSTDVYDACNALGLPVATHLAETRGERTRLPQTGIRALAGQGLLGPHVIAAHCVDLEPDEVELLARHDVGVAHCPRSNAILGCGIAPVADLLEAGVRVGLGTDSPASTPSFDMFEELRTALFFGRLRSERPEGMTAARVLELATLGSARALGLAGDAGSLEPGKRADLTIVSLADSPFLPWEDPAAAVVLGGSPARVSTTIVEGEVRYAAGRFEWRELLRRGNHARRKLLGEPRSA